MPTNRFEIAARAAKAENLALTARARRVTADDVTDPIGGGWTRRMLIANTPDVTGASDETWDLVCQLLRFAAKVEESRNVDNLIGAE